MTRVLKQFSTTVDGDVGVGTLFFAGLAANRRCAFSSAQYAPMKAGPSPFREEKRTAVCWLAVSVFWKHSQTFCFCSVVTSLERSDSPTRFSVVCLIRTMQFLGARPLPPFAHVGACCMPQSSEYFTY